MSSCFIFSQKDTLKETRLPLPCCCSHLLARWIFKECYLKLSIDCEASQEISPCQEVQTLYHSIALDLHLQHHILLSSFDQSQIYESQTFHLHQVPLFLLLFWSCFEQCLDLTQALIFNKCSKLLFLNHWCFSEKNLRCFILIVSF